MLIELLPQCLQSRPHHAKGVKPRPFAVQNSTFRPSASGTTRISENRIAASKPKRRIGCNVTSAARFGLKQRSRKPPAFSRKPDIREDTAPPAASAKPAESLHAHLQARGASFVPKALLSRALSIKIILRNLVVFVGAVDWTHANRSTFCPLTDPQCSFQKGA